MSKHGTVPPLEAKEIAALYGALTDQATRVLLPHPAVVRALAKRPKKIGAAYKTLLPKGGASEGLGEWEAFYRNVFKLELNLSGVTVPNPQDGFERLIVVAQGITLNAAIKACKERFPTWTYYNDLDKNVTINDRTNASGHYAFWVRNRIEADEELANLSADDLAKQKVPCVTLLERIIMELDYFERTKGHLDITNVTLCVGSRYAGGSVPRAYWHDGGFNVYRYFPSYSHSYLRGRRVAV